jgi:hypothetical protein
LNTANSTNFPEIKLFPNPVTDKLTIERLENTNATAEIYSILGQKLHTCVLKEEATHIDVADFQNGIYLVVVISETGIGTYKFIKK